MRENDNEEGDRMPLCTVHMKRKQIVSRFNAKGEKIAEETVLLDQVYHGLPAKTAEAYHTKFPDAQVKITEEAPSYDKPNKSAHGVYAGTGRIGGTSEQRRAIPAARPTKSEELTAAETGDMTAALNKEIEAS
jgi:hypothetical protein